MADLSINLLPAGAGNMLATDRIPVAKYNGGPYITVYRTGQEIMNAITSLSTATFTNINTSINNAITTAYNNVLAYYKEQILINQTSIPAVTANHTIFTLNINPLGLALLPGTMQQFTVVFDIFANTTYSTTISKIGKYIVSYSYDGNILQIGNGSISHIVSNNVSFNSNVNLFSNINASTYGLNSIVVKATNNMTDYINIAVKATVMDYFQSNNPQYL